MQSFKRYNEDPLTSLQIGKRFVSFGFTSKLLDKSYNDGKHVLYISEKFGKQIMYNLTSANNHWYLKDDFISRFKHKGSYTNYRCSFRFIRMDLNGAILFYTIGMCGDYGFHSSLYSKKYTLSPYVVKQCLNQLNDYLEKEFIKINSK